MLGLHSPSAIHNGSPFRHATQFHMRSFMNCKYAIRAYYWSFLWKLESFSRIFPSFQMQHFCLGPTWEFSAAIIFCPSHHRQSASWAWDSLRHACSLTRGGSKIDQSSGCCRGRAVLFVNQCPRLRELKRNHGSHNPRCVFKMKTDMRLTNFTNRLCVEVTFIIRDPNHVQLLLTCLVTSPV